MTLLLLNQCLNGCKNGMYSEYIVKQYTLAVMGMLKLSLNVNFMVFLLFSTLLPLSLGAKYEF